MKHLSTQTKEIYDRNAPAFDRQRNKSLFERPWIDRFLSLIPKEGTILDVGCGTGEPIAQHILAQQYEVVGLDISPKMIEIVSQRFPEQKWLCTDMRTLYLPQQFEGLISWGAFFHLTPDEQRSTLPRFIQHLASGGVLLLTIGHEEGDVTGMVNGEEVYHSSLSRTEYEKILVQNYCQLLDVVLQDSSCQHHSILLAQKKS